MAVRVNTSCQSVFPPLSSSLPPTSTTFFRNSSALNTGILRAICETPTFEVTVTFEIPVVPLLVVIRITPFAPLAPYMAVAEASFKTSIVSMSSGLMKFNGLDSEPVPAKPTGNPSITKSGPVPCRRLPCPRMMIRCPAPGAPLDDVMFTPDIFP